jgi:hypothetical protein
MAPKPEPHRLAFVARDVQVRVITGLLGFGIGLAMVRTILTICAESANGNDLRASTFDFVPRRTLEIVSWSAPPGGL